MAVLSNVSRELDPPACHLLSNDFKIYGQLTILLSCCVREGKASFRLIYCWEGELFLKILKGRGALKICEKIGVNI